MQRRRELSDALRAAEERSAEELAAKDAALGAERAAMSVALGRAAEEAAKEDADEEQFGNEMTKYRIDSPVACRQIVLRKRSEVKTKTKLIEMMHDKC